MPRKTTQWSCRQGFKSFGITLQPVVRVSGYEVPFRFTGIALGPSIRESVHMGEYGARIFTAIKA